MKILFSFIESPMSMIVGARHTLAILLQKDYALVKNDTAKEVGGLRIEEKNWPIDLLGGVSH